MDHDEIIFGNTTDVVIAISAAYGDSFMPYLQKLGPLIVNYTNDDHGKSDKTMALGCLAEVFNNCPVAAAPPFFDPFMQLLIKHSVTEDGSMNRNVSYGFGVMADKAPA